MVLIQPIIKFLIKLSAKNEKKLIDIPKIISIINNLLANYNIRDVAVQALKTLSYEIFLMTCNISKQQQQQSAIATSKDLQLSSLIASAATTTTTTTSDSVKQNLLSGDPNSLAAFTENLLTLNNELDTQKEVILGMLEKFIESHDCQQVLCLLLLIEQLQQQYEQNKMLNDANRTTAATITVEPSGVGTAGASTRCYENKQQTPRTTCLPNLDTVCNMICHSICLNRLHIQDWNDFYLLDTYFKNNSKYLLGNSKEFMALLKYTIEGVS